MTNDSELDEFERELTAALRRVEAPAGFAERLMQKADAHRGRVLTFPWRGAWIGSVAASLLLVGLLAGGMEHRRAGERARAEKDFARSLEITDRAMAQTRERLQRVGVVVD